MKIYCKINKEGNTLEQFLEAGFSYPTGTQLKFVSTYKDEACIIEQCRPARRSFEELLAIANVYYPGVTEKELAKLLIRKYDNEVYKYCLFFCRDIKKQVILKNSYNSGDSYKKIFCWNESYQYQNERGIGKYTSNEIIELAQERGLIVIPKQLEMAL